MPLRISRVSQIVVALKTIKNPALEAKTYRLDSINLSNETLPLQDQYVQGLKKKLNDFQYTMVLRRRLSWNRCPDWAAFVEMR